MKIKKGDKVIVISGKDRGKKSEVLKALPLENKVIVKGVNIVKKHIKAKEGEGGEIREIEKPMDVSNVMFLDEKSGKGTRIRIERKDGKRVRIAQKTGEAIK